MPRGGSVAIIAGRFRPARVGQGASPPTEEALRSFRLGARLLHDGTMRSRARARLVVLADDHEAAGFAPAPPGDGPAIPPRFLQILAAEGLSARDALLPCSEEDLRRRFLRDLDRGVRRDPRLPARADGGADGMHAAALGLGAGSPCAFAGEILRLLLDVAERQITDVVFFPPPGLSPEAALAADLVPRRAAEAGLGCPVLHLVSHAGPLIVASRAA